VDSATAVIQDGSVSLKVDTQHLRDISFRMNSAYQFIGELQIREDNDVHDSPSSKFFSQPV
jgi:CRISPR/Cas system CMR-associated protein Cmr3 (group 5 of RAMP superfamily)